MNSSGVNKKRKVNFHKMTSKNRIDKRREIKFKSRSNTVQKTDNDNLNINNFISEEYNLNNDDNFGELNEDEENAYWDQQDKGWDEFKEASLIEETTKEKVITSENLNNDDQSNEEDLLIPITNINKNKKLNFKGKLKLFLDNVENELKLKKYLFLQLFVITELKNVVKRKYEHVFMKIKRRFKLTSTFVKKIKGEMFLYSCLKEFNEISKELFDVMKRRILKKKRG